MTDFYKEKLITVEHEHYEIECDWCDEWASHFMIPDDYAHKEKYPLSVDIDRACEDHFREKWVETDKESEFRWELR